MKYPPLRDATLEQYAVLLSRGYSPQLAYREIFKRQDKGKARAYAANPRIQQRVRELQSEGAEQAGITVSWYYDQLLDLLREEREQGKHSQANRTLELLGKAAGILNPKSDDSPQMPVQVGTKVVIEMPPNGRD
jgi:hypothetical protein